MTDEGLDSTPFTSDNDFFNELKEYKPVEIKDEGDFKPLKGSYICRVTKLTHNTGTSETTGNSFDFYALNMQITEVIDGDKGIGRFLNKRYQNNNEALKKLMNDLFTAGISFETDSREAFDLSLTNAIDKQIRVRAWSWSPDKTLTGMSIPEDERIPLQMMKIVKDFKKAKTPSSDLPF